ncbi:hypothetical protein [uncultured Clostridium sp.]|nr:hypothetical protein [uncultured Clostridium sp.]
MNANAAGGNVTVVITVVVVALGAVIALEEAISLVDATMVYCR